MIQRKYYSDMRHANGVFVPSFVFVFDDTAVVFSVSGHGTCWQSIPNQPDIDSISKNIAGYLLFSWHSLLDRAELYLPSWPTWPTYLRYLSDLPNYMTRCFLMETVMMTTTLMTMTRLIMRRKILEALPPTLRSERKSNKGTFLATIVEWNLLPVSNWKGKMTRFVALKWYWWLKLWES